METTTSTTQTAPTILNSVDDLRWHHYAGKQSSRFAFHGYCTIMHSYDGTSEHTWDVYCQTDGEDILIASNVPDYHACERVNSANAAVHVGDEVPA